MKRFLLLNSEYQNVISNEDIDNGIIDIKELQRHTQVEFIKLNHKKKEIKEQILREYDLSSDQYERAIGDSFDTMTIQQIEELLSSAKERQVFLKSKFKNRIPEKRSIQSFLVRFNLTDAIEKKLHKLSEGEQSDVIETLNNLKAYRVDTIDIEHLFHYNFFSSEEKKEILLAFIPSLNLEQAIALGFITESDADNRKEEVVKEAMDYGENISAKLIAQGINNSDIYIPTKDVLTNTARVETMSSNISLKPIADGLGQILEATKESVNAR
ncbi:MAG: hypothetical protein H6767_09925 [Candidatus Peribacteria bacterium]|nr:MAG: hypothetical protein H6767_09925 [Candidatus Peribacteria bacterium]